MKTVRLNVKNRTLRFGSAIIQLDPPPVRKVRNERYDNLPLFDGTAAGWKQGRCLLAVQAHECSQTDALVPGSVQVKMDGRVMENGRDFQVNEFWGVVGRLSGGRIIPGEQVSVTYSYYPSRIDSLILKPDGTLAMVTGKEGMAHPAIPAVPKNSSRLANVYWHGDCSKLSEDWIYPVTETAFPAGLIPADVLPEKTLRKLRDGKAVRILAWGDSVTACSYLLNDSRWQEQFLHRLRKKYPRAKIELLTEGWGGRTTSAFFAVPPGEPHNFEEKVLAPKPDLVISEFVNDCGLPEKAFRANYLKIKKAFGRIGAEWIILTPHYTRPDWMKFSNSKNCDDDPRSFVKFLREFSAKNKIPLADASRYWGRLYRQGIPYETLYSNGINHPLEYGLSLFADALMKLF